MEYTFFDGLIDAVFVIGQDKGVIYCNEAAAKICKSSVRRLCKGKPIFETIEFEDPKLFTMPNGEIGKDSPHPYSEMKFRLKTGEEGKIQLSIQPFTEPDGVRRWVVMIRDVTIEEVLHAKHHKQLAELERYSKNLEQMVEERTLEVKRAYSMLNAIMNSLGQGFFVFDKEGVCSDFYTKACLDILEIEPAKKKVWDVLKVSTTEKSTFDMWMTAIFSEKLPFDALKGLGPSLFQHTQDRHINLEYFPIREEDQKISKVVVVATDKTTEHLANLALDREKKFAKMVVKLITSKKQFAQFLYGVETIVSDLKAKALGQLAEFDYEYSFRMLHTLEGEAATFSVHEVWYNARACQETIESVKSGSRRFDIDLRQAFVAGLDKLLADFSSFKESNAELFNLVGLGEKEKVEITIETVEFILQRLRQKGVSRDICQEIESAILREPIIYSFRHYQDVVKVVAEKTGKEVNPISFSGGDTRIFSSAYKDLFSAFVHAFRNAVDHGIENPDEREMLNKPRAGTIRAEFSILGNDHKTLKIVISDDGGGISAENIRNKLKLTSPETQIGDLSEDEVIQHVFDSGLSTKAEVGEFSGRGVGLNAVKFEAERLGGRAKVETDQGKGSRLIVEVPDLSRVVEKIKAA